MKNDPRIPDPTIGKSQMSSDMPMRKPVIPQRVVTPPTPMLASDEDEKPQIMRRPKSKSARGNGKLIAGCAFSALLGGLLGSLLMSRFIQANIDRSLQRQLLAQSIDRLVAVGADVRGDLTLSPEADSYSFSRVSFADISSAKETRKAVRMAASLPGVKSLSFFPAASPTVNSGSADETVLAAVAEHFPELTTLDLSCTSISSFQAIEGKKVKQLRIVNTPLSMESFTSLKLINGVEEISVGWPDRTIPKDSVLRSEGFRKSLVEALAMMLDLKKVTLYDITLDKEDREKLGKLEVSNSRL